MNTDAVRFLYRYNDWANDRMMAAAAALPPAELYRALGGSHGTVFDTLAHNLWAEWLWLSRWIHPAPRPGPDPLSCRELTALQAQWAELVQTRAALLAGLTEQVLEEPITYENPPGSSWTYSVRQVLLHVVNHSTYHRGQVASMLRQLGAVPPATDLLIYVDEYPAPR